MTTITLRAHICVGDVLWLRGTGTGRILDKGTPISANAGNLTACSLSPEEGAHQLPYP
jgi:hypothetical protein